MLSATRLLTGTASPGDALRYGRLTGHYLAPDPSCAYDPAKGK